jgi:hypothetical protein
MLFKNIFQRPTAPFSACVQDKSAALATSPSTKLTKSNTNSIKKRIRVNMSHILNRYIRSSTSSICILLMLNYLIMVKHFVDCNDTTTMNIETTTTIITSSPSIYQQYTTNSFYETPITTELYRFKRGVPYYVADGTGKRLTTAKKVTKYSCIDKEDDGLYEHKDCRKYWHCLYVGTIFENALERKCPIGTMFHPFERNCEISTLVRFVLFSFFLVLFRSHLS